MKKIAAISLSVILSLLFTYSASIFASDTNILNIDEHDEKPSSWAENQVYSALLKKLVPLNLYGRYTQAITRNEFCALAVTLYESVKKTEIEGRVAFIDTNDINVEKAAAIGVAAGIGNRLFSPNDKLTREQAAIMLARLAEAIKPLIEQTDSFVDRNNYMAGITGGGGQKTASLYDKDYISEWAIESVEQMLNASIMCGTSLDNFRFPEFLFFPKEPYTIEQSIVSIMRLRAPAWAPSLDVSLIAENVLIQQANTERLYMNWGTDGRLNTIAESFLHPLHLTDFTGITLNLGNKDGGIKLKFSDDYQPHSVSVKRWDSKYAGAESLKTSDAWNKSEPVKVLYGDIIYAGNDGRDYVYEVWAYWLEGSSQYVFRTDSK